MNSSLFAVGELPSRRRESVDQRNGAISSGLIPSTECHQRNFRDQFHGNEMECLPGRFHDVLPDSLESHSEVPLYGSGHVQRDSIHRTCTCSESEQPKPFYDDHDDHQSSSHKRCCHGMTGSSSPFGHETGHAQDPFERGCCGSVAMRRERSSLPNCMVGRTRARSRSSLFVDSLELQRNAAAVDCASNFPLTHREAETRTSSLYSGFMDSPAFPEQTKAPFKQTILYGWYLMKPREGNAADRSTFASVAIGGYRCPSMEDKDFIRTGTVVERVERWKLRTRDGLEVGLMGMINIEKSVAGGFSPSLVQCFMIGFPSAWVYMLLNMQKHVPKSSAPGIPSPSASPTSSAGPPGLTGNRINGSGGTSSTPEADPVQNILQPPLHTGGPNGKTTLGTFGGGSTATTTPTTPIVKIGDRKKRPRSELHPPVADIPLGDPLVASADSFYSSEREVGIVPEVTEENAVPESVEEVENENMSMHKADMDVEVELSRKVKVEGRARARKKRYKLSRNYYHRGKKRSSTKSDENIISPSSDKSNPNVKTPLESTNDETDESQVVEETIKISKKKGHRPKRSLSLEGPEGSVEISHLQTRTPIVRPLPSPKVTDKSNVTEAFGLKRSLHGRVLVPPLATWRNQSIKYDMDGGIIAISDGFTASEDERCTGYNFKPPADKGARAMQRRLCETADKGSKRTVK